MNRVPAWRDSLRAIEAGERAHRAGSKKYGPDYEKIALTARGTSEHLNYFAGVLDKNDYQATAVEVRRFMYDVLEPLSGHWQ